MAGRAQLKFVMTECSKTQIRLTGLIYNFLNFVATLMNEVIHSLYFLLQLSPVKRFCVFEHSVMTNFNCACPAIQRGQGPGFLSEGSS